MDRLVDYVKWMGELDFRAYPFREADAMVLAVAAYFDLSPAFASFGVGNDGGTRKSPLLCDCIPTIEAGELKLIITGGDQGNTELFEAAARSRRFGLLRMSHYVDMINKEEDLQFAAVCFHYEPERYGKGAGEPFSFISFRGTDNTIVGWKEDFKIAFTRPKAQTLAADYVRQRLEEEDAALSDGRRKSPKRRGWYIGGHSKGGNLSLYAGCMLPKAQFKRIKRVFCLDGPGFCPEVLDPALLERIDSKTTRIIPEFEIVGKLFEPKITDTRIVKSNKKGFGQHSLPSWLVEYGDLAETDHLDIRSRWLGDNLNAWISTIPQADRQSFVEELFDALDAGAPESLDDFKIEHFRDAMVALSKSSERTKYVLSSLPEKFLQAETLGELGAELKESLIQGIKAGAEKIHLPEISLPEGITSLLSKMGDASLNAAAEGMFELSGGQPSDGLIMNVNDNADSAVNPENITSLLSKMGDASLNAAAEGMPESSGGESINELKKDVNDNAVNDAVAGVVTGPADNAMKN